MQADFLFNTTAFNINSKVDVHLSSSNFFLANNQYIVVLRQLSFSYLQSSITHQLVHTKIILAYRETPKIRLLKTVFTGR